MIKIKSLHIYPIKSLGGIDLEIADVTSRGLAFDRRWVIVDENNRFISQRECPKMAKLIPNIKSGQMEIIDFEGPIDRISFPLTSPNTQAEDVTIWDDVVPAKEVSKEVSAWLSKYMGRPARLMYMHEESIRQADQRYAISPNDQVSFADGYPILIISEAALELLNSKLDEPIPMNRFRPNIVVSGTTAHEEDSWRKIATQSQTLYGVKPCARCKITTIDQETGVSGKEPLRTLATYRQTANKILFGENFIPTNEGQLAVGDVIAVLERKAALIM